MLCACVFVPRPAVRAQSADDSQPTTQPQPSDAGSVPTAVEVQRASPNLVDALDQEDFVEVSAFGTEQVARRMTGVHFTDDRFFNVRGLGGRYTNVLLDGVPLPSPDLETSAVSLDLFPFQILERLEITKTFLPNVPGDFAGGYAHLRTRSVPEGWLYGASLSLGANTQSTFQQHAMDAGSGSDLLGFDSTRALPGAVPSDYPLSRGATRPDGTRVDEAELTEVGRAVNGPMAPGEQTFGPDFGGTALLGHGWRNARGLRLGTLASLAYQLRNQAWQGQASNYVPTVDGPQPWREAQFDYANQTARWNALGAVTLDVSDRHSLRLQVSHSQAGDNRTWLGEGFSANEMRDSRTTDMQFVSRALTAAQLAGEHRAPALNDAVFEWRAFLNRTARDEPNSRSVRWSRPAVGGDWVFSDDLESGQHQWTELAGLAGGGAFDYRQPLWKGRFAAALELGTLIDVRGSELRSRRLTFRPVPGQAAASALSCGPTYDTQRCNGALFVDSNIGRVLNLEENSRAEDTVDFSRHVYAGYAMLDLDLGPHWRVDGGARLEKSRQELNAVDPFSGETVPDRSSRQDALDVLPGMTVAYWPVESLGLRGALSRTVARPEFRELAPFAYADPGDGVSTVGDPALTSTHVLNADIAAEWYPGPDDRLAATGFVKQLDAPVIPVTAASASMQVRRLSNAESARVLGLELEARKGLAFIAAALRDLTLIGNLMVARSRVELPEGAGFDTSRQRALAGQAPYVLNLALDYAADFGFGARLMYHGVGAYIVEAAVDGLPDAYLQARHSLDLTLSQALAERWSLRLMARNLTNGEYLVTQGKEPRDDNVRLRYREGVDFWLTAALDY